MAYIHAASENQVIADATFVEVRLAAHASGDLLIITVGKDDATGGTLSTPSGWNAGGELAYGSSGANTVRGAWFWKWAASSSEAWPTVTSSDTDTWCAVALTIKDAYYNVGSPGDFIDVSNTNSAATGVSYIATALTTNYANSLYIVMAHCDGAVSLSALPGVMNAASSDSGANGCGVAWTIIPTAGTTGTMTFYGTSTGDETVFLKVAIRNKSGGKIPGYPNTDCATLPLDFYHLCHASAAAETSNANFRAVNPRNPTYVYRDDGGSFTDLTTAATNDTTADVAFRASEAINDALYVGLTSGTFGGLSIDRNSCTAGAGGALAFEYYDGSTWKAVSNLRDATTNLLSAVAARQVVGWTIPSNWTTTTVNSQTAYWIRLRITTVFSTNPTITRIYVCDRPMEYDASAAVADTGLVSYHSSLGVTPPGTGNVISGTLYNLGADNDFSGSSRYLLGTYTFSTPRQYQNIGPTSVGAGLQQFWFDNSNNYKGWLVGAFGDTDTRPDARNYYAIQPSQSQATHWAVSSTAPGTNAYRKVSLTPNCLLGASTIYWSQVQYINKLIINGGSADYPLQYADVSGVSKGSNLPFIIYGYTLVPMQFGGDKAINCDLNLCSFTFPRVAYDGGTMIHVDPGIMGVIIDARSGDVVKIRNSTILGESRIKFEVLATASASATYDFSGLSVVNATVTLRDVTTFDSLSFVSCPTITQNGATISHCTLTGCEVTSNDPGEISWCAFTSSGSGHGLVITAPGTYTFTGNTFTGYGAAGSTDAAVYNNSGGAVTLNVSGGGDTPTVRNGSGASTTVNNTVTLTLTGIKTGSEVRIYTHDTTTELDGEESNSTGSFEFGYSYVAGTYVDIVVHHVNYLYYRVENYLLSNTDSSLPISQTEDRNYANP